MKNGWMKKRMMNGEMKYITHKRSKMPRIDFYYIRLLILSLKENNGLKGQIQRCIKEGY